VSFRDLHDWFLPFLGEFERRSRCGCYVVGWIGLVEDQVYQYIIFLFRRGSGLYRRWYLGDGFR
jgi:hypothetical protein